MPPGSRARPLAINMHINLGKLIGLVPQICSIVYCFNRIVINEPGRTEKGLKGQECGTVFREGAASRPPPTSKGVWVSVVKLLPQ